MKKLSILILLCLSASHCMAATSIEVFCTSRQCQKLGLASAPANTVIYVLDAHLQTANVINNTVFKGVTTLEQAESLLPNLERSDIYQKLIADLKGAGIGMQKMITEYQLRKLPAFVCHRRNIDSGEEQSAVIYGGIYSRASAMCEQWAKSNRGQK